VSRATRRQFLQGAAGTTLALPLFESLAVGKDKRSRPRQRMAIYYIPMGVVRKGFFPGEEETLLPKFNGATTKAIGIERSVGTKAFEDLTPTQEPLEPIKKKVSFISGLDRTYKQGTDVHAQCGSCFLSSATMDSVTESAYPLDRTFDHIVADSIGAETPFRTLTLSCNSHQDNKESIHFDNISWYGTGHVTPSIRDVRQAYRRLFGTQARGSFRNITDLVLEDAKELQRDLNKRDQDKFKEYFAGIRSLELQIDRLEGMRDEIKAANIDLPADALLPRGEYIRTMGDIMVAALQTGLTNVATLMIGPERWNTPYLFESLFDKPMSHHTMTHAPHKFVNELLQIDKFYMQQYVYICQRMDAIIEFDGSTLLDNTIFTYGSGLGDGTTHQFNDLPILMAGGEQLGVKQGQHTHVPNNTPLANLFLTQAQLLGIEINAFADSTTTISDMKR